MTSFRWTLAFYSAALLAQSPTEFFERDVRPLFAKHCYSCHSAQAKSLFAGLRLDSSSAVTKGADTGPVIIPGNPAQSKLIRAIRGQGVSRMPPSGKLNDNEIAALTRWIENGALWPAEPTPSSANPAFNLQQRRREHWAWQPVSSPTPPAVRDKQWPLQPTDNFVLAKLEARALKPAPAASPLTLLRRATFDLTGLPPTEAEIAAYLADTQPGAYNRLIDRLLTSPHYAERMARRWMDLIRYSDSHGSEGDPDVPFAWRYRDALIRAFAQDVPYNQLIREHIAGDLLPNPRLHPTEHTNESRLALAHFRMVEHGFQPVDPWEDRVKWADNQIDVLAKTFQGLTISCARCHDHKFDAISQRDYYALFGILYGMRPTQSTIDEPALLNRNRDALAALKPRIKDQIAALWRTEAAALPTPAATGSPAAASPGAFTLRWHLAATSYDAWPRQGIGAPSAPSSAGEFFLQPSGPKAITGIYPPGIYSHHLSQRHAAVVTSPRFKIETDAISIRMAGGNYSNAVLIVENYAVPRGGIYNLRSTAKRDTFSWVRWDTTFWKGFTAYIEFSTHDDTTHFQLDDEDNRQKPAPKPARDGRSWFGLTDVVFHNNTFKPQPPPTPVAQPAAVQQAVEAWAADHATAEQAALLDHCVRTGLLSSDADKLPLVAEYRRLENEIPIPRRAPGLIEEAGPDHPLLLRGDHRKPGQPVPRSFLTALDSRPYPNPATMRLNLANEIASPANPLTARVIVNRLWAIAFRRGIVPTVDNFGKLGQPPSHPELLDHLATRFVNDGWSIRNTLRLILTSRAYQMSDAAPTADPNNDLFSHVPLRRLEAEEIRDAILQSSGQLKPDMYGPPVPVYYAHDTGATKGDRAKGPLDGNGRRGVYLEIRRNATNPFLEVWDVYKPTSTRGQRDVTTVPAQSLALMNSPFVIDQAAKWASSNPSTETLYLRVFGRPPTPAELDSAATFRAETGLASLCHALWNFKEFLYVR